MFRLHQMSLNIDSGQWDETRRNYSIWSAVTQVINMEQYASSCAHYYCITFPAVRRQPLVHVLICFQCFGRRHAKGNRIALLAADLMVKSRWGPVKCAYSCWFWGCRAHFCCGRVVWTQAPSLLLSQIPP
jgi:hypothetical protein